jgi:hypothetical protein
VEAQQCVELTSTNRSFGLIIKLSHAVMRELEVVLVLYEQTQYVRQRAELVCQPISVVSGAAFFGGAVKFQPIVHRTLGIKFPVIIPRGSHPFPSRTRKLSLAGPMVLHG